MPKRVVDNKEELFGAASLT